MVDSRAVPALELMAMDEMLARLTRVLAASPADETEIAWLEVLRGRVGTGKRPRDGERRERTLLVRVRESGRMGFQRTGEATISELENAVRTALAQARLALPSPPTPASPAPPEPPGAASRPTDRGPELLDLELAQMSAAEARDLVQRVAGQAGAARLAWAAARVVVARSDGRLRSAEVTAAALEVSQGSGPGAGSAAAAARSLAGLAPEAVAERAHRRQAPQAPETLAEPPAGPAPLDLAPEAAAALIDLLNRLALSATAFREGTSPLSGRLGQPVFHPAVSLRDDGTDPRGLPFPFDLAGAAKRPVDLIGKGVVLTPAVDPLLAGQLGRAATPHAVALDESDESLASNLFLLPGAAAEDELLGLAGNGGLWVGSLAPLECFDRRELRFRAVARGVRRIADGALGPAVPDLVWEGSLV
ncbi:MAG TPA: metallopeptidase TldD-related protein, partial [Thermoanaerobaculia bacterium]|nr:metallopeptidase TldD-related protein [Thermoanaerobaculia bacterium]